MLKNLARFGALACGVTTGGLLVGLGEAAYRDVAALYGALLYGCLWAMAGIAAAICLGLVWRKPTPLPYQMRIGLLLSLVPSTLVLVRFVALRDFLLESPSAGLKALILGAAAAVAIALVVLMVARSIGRILNLEPLGSPRLWIAPLLVIIAFAARTRAGDDDLPTSLPQASALTGGGVIFIVVDTLRADVLGAYGSPLHRGQLVSPVFDALAARGRLFTDMSAQASWTRPAVASLLTSRHVSGHDTMSKAAVLPESLPTVATQLHDAGVKTAAVVTNYNLEAGYGFARGFDSYRYLAPARYLGAPQRANRLAAYNIYRLLRERLLSNARNPDHFYRSAHTVNAVGLTLLDEIGNDQFFLWLHYMEPHDPYFDTRGRSWAKVSDPNPPTAWAEEMMRAYLDDVKRFDVALGELLEALEKRGLSERTTIILVSDHGEEFGDHGGFYHGVTLYEEQLHVPMAISGPGITPGVETGLARQIDIPPTVLSRFALPSPESWEGRNLLGSEAPPETTLAEENHEGNVLASVRSGDKKLILANPENPRGLPPEELFDLAIDAAEKKNIAANSVELDTLREQIKQLKQQSRRGGAQSEKREMDADTEAELRALGYVR